MGYDHEHSHRLRFYIVLITLVLGGILFAVYMMKGSISPLTSAIVGAPADDTLTGDFSDFGSTSDSVSDSVSDRLSDTFGTNSKTTSTSTVRGNSGTINGVSFHLSLDEIPRDKEEVSLEAITLTFTDFATEILISDNKLELDNLDSVTMTLQGFDGILVLKDGTFSIKGKTARVSVNNVALSSRGDLDILFDGLNYRSLTLTQIGLKDLTLNGGTEGRLDAGSKLSWALGGEQIGINTFRGDITIDKDAEKLLEMTGMAKEIAVGGEALSANLK